MRAWLDEIRVMPQAKGVTVKVAPGTKHARLYGELADHSLLLGIVPHNDRGAPDTPGRAADNFRANVRRNLNKLRATVREQMKSQAKPHAV